jgi:hypothetical protein
LIERFGRIKKEMMRNAVSAAFFRAVLPMLVTPAQVPAVGG